MNNKLDTFKWKYGVHCSSTAVLNLLSYYGIELNEETIMGLGQGLGWVYIKDKTLPFPYLSGRGSHLIQNALRSLGISVKNISGSIEVQLEALKYRLSNGHPTIVTLDLNKLPYIYDKLFDRDIYYPFSEHHALVIGMDDSKIVIKDHLWEPINLDIEKFKDSWSSSLIKPFELRNYYFDISSLNLKIDKDYLKNCVYSSLYNNVHNFLYPCNPVNQSTGIKGLTNFLNDFKRIKSLYSYDELNLILYITYLPLEKIGTGGGNFRRIFAKFLRSAAEIINNEKLEIISHEYMSLGAMWKSFITLLENKIKNQEYECFNQEVELLTEVVNKEIDLANLLKKSLERIKE